MIRRPAHDRSARTAEAAPEREEEEKLGGAPSPDAAAELVQALAPHARGAMVQRLAAAYGNRFVGRVAATVEEAPLPASADNLRRFRDGMPKLKDAAGLQAPTVDLADLAGPQAW